MAPFNGYTFQAVPEGGTAPFTYQWDFASKYTPGMLINPAMTAMIPTVFGATNLDTIQIHAPTADQFLSVMLRCKITDSTGGVANPATNLVTYATFNIFTTAEFQP